VSILGGGSSSATTGSVTVATSNAGSSGTSGSLLLSSGTAHDGNSGFLVLQSGFATSGKAAQSALLLALDQAVTVVHCICRLALL